MRRLHLHLRVPEIKESISFYSRLFGSPPEVVRSDYASWRLQEPTVNFAISARGKAPGVDHLGLQFDSVDELGSFADRTAAEGLAAKEQPSAHCCYAHSDKVWFTDPAGMSWEGFVTHDRSDTFGTNADVAVAAEKRQAAQQACC